MRAAAGNAVGVPERLEYTGKMTAAKFWQRECLVAIPVSCAKISVDTIGVVGRCKRRPGVRDDLVVGEDRVAHVSFIKRVSHEGLG
jgi:dissimilatory sulfite reductase (desulfoviridin) alpha/beta subunit